LRERNVGSLVLTPSFFKKLWPCFLPNQALQARD
jgi:hypothetical protein